MGTLSSIKGRRGEQVAVLLNANAKAVNDKLRRELSRFIPEQDIYYSRTLTDARAIVATVLEQRYTTLLTGGGDGTFVGYVNEVYDVLGADAQAHVFARGNTVLKVQPKVKPPKFGVLKLGTGNSLAGLLGASGTTVGVVEDILRARAGDVAGTRHVHLIDAGRKLAPFAGLGLDARIINDFMSVKTAFASTPLNKVGAGGAGYFLAIAGKTIPKLLMERQPAQVTITNEGAPAQQIAPDGRPAGPLIATGDVVYKGPCRIAAAGTVPCYGYGFQIFPFALKTPGRMHLRVTAMSVPEILSHLPTIWKGRTPRSGLLDFQVEKVRLKFDRPMPFQIGGDAEGYRDEVVLGVDPRTVEMLDFRAQS